MLPKVEAIALTAHPDEPCWGMREGPVGDRRVLRFLVVRGDNLAVYSEDLGSVSNFPRSPDLVMPSFGENTVAELREFAERDRYDDKYLKQAEEQLAQSTMIEDVIRDIDIEREIIKNRSSIGPAVSTQRNDFDRAKWRRNMRRKARGNRV